MAENEQELLERLGGPAAVADFIKELYERVLADPALAPFFEKTSMDRVRKMQYEFLVAALDGPVSYSGAELTAVHRGRGITDQHFATFCGHFADVLEAHGISSADIDLVLSRLSMAKDKVVGTTNTGG
ncbi:group I truncated hemoglobin [Allorhodopirellula solitaria]|nr:group 1 truncated hemoglobin [Allorhodopirellula solitaria]